MKKFEIINECIQTGDWSVWDEVITRKDLMDYILQIQVENKKTRYMDCPLCLSNLKAHKHTLTHRAVKYMMCLGYLGKSKNGYDYVHYEEVNNLSKKIYNISYTSYGLLFHFPWDFTEPQKDKETEKYKRNGYMRLTANGSAFLRGQVAVPEVIWVQNNEVIKKSKKLVNVINVKNVDFQSTVDSLKSF